MALTASRHQGVGISYLDLGKASDALGAESVGGSHLCEEVNEWCLHYIRSAH